MEVSYRGTPAVASLSVRTLVYYGYSTWMNYLSILHMILRNR